MAFPYLRFKTDGHIPERAFLLVVPLRFPLNLLGFFSSPICLFLLTHPLFFFFARPVPLRVRPCSRDDRVEPNENLEPWAFGVRRYRFGISLCDLSTAFDGA